MIIALLLTFLSGVTRVASRMVNAELAKEIGVIGSTFYNYVIGLACSLAVLYFVNEPDSLFLVFSGKIPLWAHFGGLVGVVFILLSNAITPKISALQMTLLIFVGQVGSGLILDGLQGQALSTGKIAGAIFILAGLFLFSLPSSNQLKGDLLQ